MLKEKISHDLRNKFDDAIDIKIITDDDKHFNITIVSDFFKDKQLIDRQKSIYDVIGKYILNREIHAVSLKVYTKDEWKEMQ